MHDGEQLAGASRQNEAGSDRLDASGVISPGQGHVGVLVRAVNGTRYPTTGTASDASVDLTLVLTPVPYIWEEPVDGVFSDASRWESGAPPTPVHAAIFDEAGSYTVSLDDHTTVAQTRVLAGDVTLALAGHSLASDALRLGDGAALTFTGGVASITDPFALGHGTELAVQRAGAKLAAQGAVRIGEGGEAVLFLNDGGAADVDGALALGVAAGDDGTVTVAGEDSKLTARAGATVGERGTGLLWVREGAAAEIREQLALGAEAGATGNVLVEDEGSKVEVKGDLAVGDGGLGNVSVLGGAKLETKELADDAEGKTTVGAQPGASGRILVDGEDSRFISKGSLTLGDEGHGLLEISDGGAVTAKAGAKLGAEPVSSGTATVEGDGSTLAVEGTLALGDGGSGRLTVSDGATGSADAVMLGEQLHAIGELTVSGPMSVFEVDGMLTAGAAGHAEVLVEAGGRLSAASLAVGTEAVPVSRVVTVEGTGSVLATGETLIGDRGAGGLEIRGGARVESGLDAVLGQGPFGHGTALVTGPGSQWAVGGMLTLGDGGFGELEVAHDGRLESAGGRLGATGNGGPGHATITGPGSQWTSTEQIVLAGTEAGAIDPGPSTGQAILNVLDGASVEAPVLTLGAGLAPGYLNLTSGATLNLSGVGLDLLWGNVDVDGAGTEVRAPAGTLAVGNGNAAFTGGALGVFDTVAVRAPLGGGSVSELVITESTVTATNIVDPAVVVGGETGGTIAMAAGVLDAEGGEVHVADHGSLLGTGTVRGNVTVTGSGLLAPGLSPGTLTIEGDYAQGPEGVLQIEFAGLGAGEFDILHVTGDAFLGGTLELLFLDGYLPQAGDVLGFLQVDGALDGSFDDILFPNLSSGFEVSEQLALIDGAYSFTALNDARAHTQATQAVSAPGSAVLVWLGLAGVWLARRRRRPGPGWDLRRAPLEGVYQSPAVARRPLNVPGKDAAIAGEAHLAATTEATPSV